MRLPMPLILVREEHDAEPTIIVSNDPSGNGNAVASAC